MPHPCIFCYRNATLTAEHLWGAWVGKLYDFDEKYSIARRRHDGNLQQWSLKELKVTAKIVCSECNNTWMSDIEDAASKLLGSSVKEGNPISFLPKGVSTIAAFAFKNAIVSDHTYRERTPFFPFPVRDRFRRRLEIPAGVQMWIARLGGDYFQGIFRSYTFRVGTPPGPLRNAEFFCFTWSAGCLVLQVLAVRRHRPSRTHNKLPLPELIPDPKWNYVSVRFWPNNGRPITWSPANNLGSKSLQVFSDRWHAPVKELLIHAPLS